MPIRRKGGEIEGQGPLLGQDRGKEGDSLGRLRTWMPYLFTMHACMVLYSLQSILAACIHTSAPTLSLPHFVPRGCCCCCCCCCCCQRRTSEDVWVVHGDVERVDATKRAPSECHAGGVCRQVVLFKRMVGGKAIC